jgi:DNA-binding response OmpR family regulator
MLSNPVDMPSQDSEEAATACSNKIEINTRKRKLEINGKIIGFGPKEFVVVKFLFEKINTPVPTDDLYVAVYGGKAGDWKKDSLKEKKRFYALLLSLRMKIPENYLKGEASIGYMLSNPVDRTSHDADSPEVSENEEDGGNLQKIQYDSENYPLIGDYYLDDYAQFIKDNKSIRNRYINVQKSPGFIKIGGIYISFTENKVTINGRYVAFYPKEIQVLRLLALWYPKLVSCEQIYYNLSFCTKRNYGCPDESPAIKKCYLVKIISRVKVRLKSDTDGIRISPDRKKGYRLVCRPKRQTCPNESSVQDALHSQSTSSICTLAQGEQMQSVA